MIENFAMDKTPTPFEPAVIIESTSFCDRACNGCYAANKVSRESPHSLLEKNPEAFITPGSTELALESILSETEAFSENTILSIRGGEPSLHPEMPRILSKIRSKWRGQIAFETHGRWILKEDGRAASDTSALIEAIEKETIQVKISFDQMHGLSAADLRRATDILDMRRIQYRVAITESSFEQFKRTRELCSWVNDEKVIYQPLARNENQLNPQGSTVIGVDGSIKKKLNVRPSFKNALTTSIGSRGFVSQVAILLLLSIGIQTSAAGVESNNKGNGEKTISTVVIGLASNFSEVSTGNLNPYADHFRNGVRTALANRKKALEKKGIRIEWKEFDYGTSQTRVIEAARSAVSSDAIGVIGYNYSSQALIAAPIHQMGKLPMITPSASADRIGRMGDFIHSACFNNTFMGKVLATTASRNFSARTAGIIAAADCAYCQDLANSFETQFKELGGKVNLRAQILEADTDFSKIVAQIKEADADVLLIPNQELTSARVISAIQKAGIKKIYLGGDGWGDSGAEFFSVLHDKNLQAYSVTHWHPERQNSISTAFSKQYKLATGRNPTDTAVLAYDSAMILFEALLSTPKLTRESLEKSLQEIREYRGVTGKFLYSKGGSPRKSMVTLQAKDGKFTPSRVIEVD